MKKPEQTTISYYEYPEFRDYLIKKHTGLKWDKFWIEQSEYYRRGEMMHFHAEDMKDDYPIIGNVIELEFGIQSTILFDW